MPQNLPTNIAHNFTAFRNVSGTKGPGVKSQSERKEDPGNDG